MNSNKQSAKFSTKLNTSNNSPMQWCGGIKLYKMSGKYLWIDVKELDGLKKIFNQWKELDEKIHTLYFDENGNELPEEDGGDLSEVGEFAATAYGYL